MLLQEHVAFGEITACSLTLSLRKSENSSIVSLNPPFRELIGQMTQSVVIGLLCSDWSGDPVCSD